MTALKSTIDPKLKEVTRLSEQAQSDKAQAELLLHQLASERSSLDQQRTDLATLSTRLQAKSEALLQFDEALQRKHAELRVKLQQAKGSGVVVEDVTATGPPTKPSRQPS